ncbi:hypothetical protein PABG_06168 [Paracoccidioides brasiliensis Pb03]|nr:hypothetical protein PABG_06168 [Paracoccidioides brasiliensis Pb03]
MDAGRGQQTTKHPEAQNKKNVKTGNGKLLGEGDRGWRWVVDHLPRSRGMMSKEGREVKAKKSEEEGEEGEDYGPND